MKVPNMAHLPHRVISKGGVIMGAHPTRADAQTQADKLNASRSMIDRMNGPYRIESRPL